MAKQTKAELAQLWDERIQAADLIYQAWARRFEVSKLYQYYEGFQVEEGSGDIIKPYIINMIYSTIEVKLPSLIFNNPEFDVKPRPRGVTYNMEEGIQLAQIREDALNYVCSREEFGLTDKHELALLDAFFGFGVLEIDYSKDAAQNPYLFLEEDDPLKYAYCKHIPFDHFRVAAEANWDLSIGKWCGYFDFVSQDALSKYKIKLNSPLTRAMVGGISNLPEETTSKIVLDGSSAEVIPPEGYIKVWHLWDFKDGKKYLYYPDGINASDKILSIEKIDYCTLATLRFGKRRKGWYPLPPVFNWTSPQEEINDIRQAHRTHRKRFSRKYAVLEGAIDDSELDKFLYLPDGGNIKVKRQDAIKPIEDMLQNPTNQQSLVVSYDDFNKISGTSSEARGVSDRTTATQAGIIDRRSQIRESKDFTRVGNFLVTCGRNILKALRKADTSFWVKSKLQKEKVLELIEPTKDDWKQVPPGFLGDDDSDISVKLTSISPVYAQEDKRSFLEFLAVLTQYEILSFSPALLREAAYRCGYKNERVLEQFQQLAQLASIGRMVTAQKQVEALTAQIPGAEGGVQPTAPGSLPQRQVDVSTPPEGQEIMNMIFNRQGIQE